MSYDFELLRLAPGEDPDDALARVEEDAEAEGPKSPIDPAKEERKRKIAEALVASDPTLQPFKIRHAEIAASMGITEDEARRRYRYLELNGPEAGPGIQVSLEDDTAAVTVPYWHQGEAANRVFATIWQYLRVLGDVGGFRVYDPQLGRFLDLERDRATVLAGYVKTVVRTQGAMSATPERKRPWWKFW